MVTFQELEPRWNSSSMRDRTGSPVGRVSATATHPQYETCCQGKQTAIMIDKFSRFFFPFSFFVLNIAYWTTFL
jgi:histamine-gated chloride channel